MGGSLWYFMKSHLRRSSVVIVANTICMCMFFLIAHPSPVSLWWWLIRMSHLGWQCYFCVCSCLWVALSVVFVLSAAWGSKRERWREGERSRVPFQMCVYGPVKGGVGVRGTESEPVREWEPIMVPCVYLFVYVWRSGTEITGITHSVL